jgi:xanthine dehydrogenase accessory factor
MRPEGGSDASVWPDLSHEDLRQLKRNKGVLVKTDGGRLIFAEPVSFAGKVIIFGAGHCSQALVPVLAGVEFRCLVYDNRAEFVSGELFPAAAGLVVGDYEKITDTLEINANDYIVIMTHAWDLAVLRQIAGIDCAYKGCIGSKTKVATIKSQLAAEGVPKESLEKLHAPIGLKIKAETPQEIAISIAAELIQCRAENRAAHNAE